jgi:hypothetical protein
MSPRQSIESPDATPAFLSAELIRGWIANATSEVREQQHQAELDHLKQLHAIEMSQALMAGNLRALAGDGGNDLGSVGRLAKVVDGFVEEQRKSNTAATETAEQTKKQLGEIKHIPKVIRDLWKLVIAVVGGIVLLMTLWTKLHAR